MRRSFVALALLGGSLLGLACNAVLGIHELSAGDASADAASPVDGTTGHPPDGTAPPDAPTTSDARLADAVAPDAPHGDSSAPGDAGSLDAAADADATAPPVDAGVTYCDHQDASSSLFCCFDFDRPFTFGGGNDFVFDGGARCPGATFVGAGSQSATFDGGSPPSSLAASLTGQGSSQLDVSPRAGATFASYSMSFDFELTALPVDIIYLWLRGVSSVYIDSQGSLHCVGAVVASRLTPGVHSIALTTSAAGTTCSFDGTTTTVGTVNPTATTIDQFGLQSGSPIDDSGVPYVVRYDNVITRAD
jgi:hypothetical protein